MVRRNFPGLSQACNVSLLKRPCWQVCNVVLLFMRMAVCLNCEIAFIPHWDSFGKYCSNRCQRAHQRPAFEDLRADKSRRLRLIQEFGHRCWICSLSEWMGLLIHLELDHVDGDSTNNLKLNLRILCPNCHSQTPTYKAKNKGRGRKWRQTQLLTNPTGDAHEC